VLDSQVMSKIVNSITSFKNFNRAIKLIQYWNREDYIPLVFWRWKKNSSTFLQIFFFWTQSSLPGWTRVWPSLGWFGYNYKPSSFCIVLFCFGIFPMFSLIKVCSCSHSFLSGKAKRVTGMKSIMESNLLSKTQKL
jgi:hypothetical protein